jgi:Tol biopolymer transport system component
MENGKPKGIPQMIKREMGPLFALGFSQKGSFFFAQGSGSRDIYTANVDLADAKLLDRPTIAIKQNLGSNFSPAWSPDGQSLAYISPSMPVGVGKNVIYIRSVKTGEEHILSPPLDWMRGGTLQWFPDGKHLMVCGGDSDKVIGHFQIDVQSGDAKLICPGEKGVQFFHASISPESNKFYYIKNYWSEKLSLVICRDIVTGEENEVCRKEGGKIRFTGISVSPNGKRIALRMSLGDTPAPSSLSIVPAEGGELVELARIENPFWLSGTAWVPDSRSLLFTKMTRVPNPGLREEELYLISAEGGEPESLGVIGTGVGSLSIHPEGKQIIFERNEYKVDVWSMENYLPVEKPESKGGQR